MTCSRVFERLRSSASRPARCTSRSTCPSACRCSRWSACPTPVCARAAIVCGARSAIPASSSRRTGSPSTSRRPMSARPAPRSISRSRWASWPRPVVIERRHVPEIVLLGELSLDGSIHGTRGRASDCRGGEARRPVGDSVAGVERRRSGDRVGPRCARRVVARRSRPRAERSVERRHCAAQATGTSRAGCAGSGGSARTTAGAPRARNRRGRRTQPAADWSARRRQDDDGATCARASCRR